MYTKFRVVDIMIAIEVIMIYFDVVINFWVQCDFMFRDNQILL